MLSASFSRSPPLAPAISCSVKTTAATYVAPGEDRRQVYDKTQIYLKDALHTVTQHVCKAADGLAQTVELQSVELEGVDAMVRPPLPPATCE